VQCGGCSGWMFVDGGRPVVTCLTGLITRFPGEAGRCSPQDVSDSLSHSGVCSLDGLMRAISTFFYTI
jgi:hypothetical protein